MSKEHFKMYSAVHLFLIQGDEIVLLRRCNTGWSDGMYSTIAGHIDGNETVIDAMIREAREEAGIEIAKEDLRVVHTMHRNSGDKEYIDFFLVCNQWTGEMKNLESDKCDDLAWFPIDKLPENTVPYIREAIRHFKEGVAFSEFGW